MKLQECLRTNGVMSTLGPFVQYIGHILYVIISKKNRTLPVVERVKERFGQCPSSANKLLQNSVSEQEISLMNTIVKRHKI